MKIKNLLILLAIFFAQIICYAQVGINNTSPKATLDITASNVSSPTNTDGILIPRVDDFPVSSPTADQDGMLVFVTGNGTPAKGFYYWDNTTTTWVLVSGSNVQKIDGLTDGKSDVDGTQDGSSIFLGINSGNSDDASDNRNIGIGFQSLESNTTGYQNTATGYMTLNSNTLGYRSTATGYQSLNSNTLGYRNTATGFQSLYSNTTGDSNTAIGSSSLYSNTTADGNTAFGYESLYSNTTGGQNSATGNLSLYSNTTGVSNTAIGGSSLYRNITGSQNTAIGGSSLYSNTTGNNNTATGNSSLYSNTTGNNNTATGYESLYRNTTGSQNTAAGYLSLYFNTTGVNNTATGFQSLRSNTTGGYNTANGISSLSSNTTGDYNTATGNLSLSSNTTGGSNTATGSSSLRSNTTGGSNTANGYRSLYSNTIGNQNTAIGNSSLSSNTTGGYNTAIGNSSLHSNTTGGSNTATGSLSLRSNTSGEQNTATGYQSLRSNTTGFYNTAIGGSSLFSNTTGGSNTANGYESLFSNTTGGSNTASGNSSLYSNTTGIRNTAIGYESLKLNISGEANTAIGFHSLLSNIGSANVAIGSKNLFRNTSGSGNIAIGHLALQHNTTGNRNIAIGKNAGDSNDIGDLNVFIGFSSGYFETGSNKIYIENTDADADNALIYGEFGADNTTTGNILRTNSEFQIGNPTGTGFAFPLTDGTANQVMATNGAGVVSFVNPSSIFTDTDDQQVDQFDLTGTTLNLSLQDDGVAVNTVDLSSLQDGDTQNTLDQAYDEGGAGAGRTINTTNGAVLLSGADGLEINGDQAGIVITNTSENESGIHFRDSGNTTQYADVNFDNSNSNTSLNLYVNSVTPMLTLDDNQNVGVGTTTPDEKLSVAGILNLNEGIASGRALKVNGTEALWFDGTQFSWGFGGTQNYFADDVGIGFNNPNYKLDVRDNPGGDYVAQIYNTSTNANADGLKIKLGRTSPITSNNFIGFYDGSDNPRGEITGNATGVQYNTTSDRRLKTNIVSIHNALDIIEEIQPRKYEFKSNRGMEEYGFIAQELQLAYPQAVSGDPNSNVKTDPMMVDYSRLTPILTAGIKELKEENKQLKEIVMELKEEIINYKQLEKRIIALEEKLN